jgi:hypothetical protein
MKTRNGFVSNSSSSSFIINGKIQDVAKSMLKTVIADYSDGNKSKKDLATYKKWTDNLKKALKNKDVLSGKLGVTMPSCNYETYIIKVNDETHVSTSRNHEWDLDYIRCGGGSDDGENDIVYQSIENADFIDVRNSMVHSREHWVEDIECPACIKNGCYGHGPYIICEGKTLCSDCYGEVKIK